VILSSIEEIRDASLVHRVGNSPISARRSPACAGAAGRPLDRSRKLSRHTALHRRHRRPAANEIASTLERINRKPFEVALQGLSSFGGKKPRAVVASVVPSCPLMELQAELERLMQRFGFDPEGRKSPVTLARLRDASNQDVADYLSRAGFDPQLHGLPVCVVLVPRVGGRRAVCGRRCLCVERIERRSSPL
jgi:hypothetical protein